MSMLQFDPFRELERLIEWPVSWTRPSAMPMDAYRHGEAVEVDFDLPGVDASDIEMTVEQNVLTVKTVRHRTPIEGEEVIASERPQGSFTRQLFLGENLDSGSCRGLLRERRPACDHPGRGKLESPPDRGGIGKA